MSDVLNEHEVKLLDRIRLGMTTASDEEYVREQLVYLKRDAQEIINQALLGMDAKGLRRLIETQESRAIDLRNKKSNSVEVSL